MPTLLEVRRPQTIEHGSITFLYRPRIGEQHTDELHDVQRLLLLLSPDDSAFERLIAVGRERAVRTPCRDRFWGFVDMVLTSGDMTAALSGQVYGTSTDGLRHIPAAHVFAEGTYTITIHEDHSHLRWHVEQMARDPIAFQVQVEGTRSSPHDRRSGSRGMGIVRGSRSPGANLRRSRVARGDPCLSAAAAAGQRFCDRPFTQSTPRTGSITRGRRSCLARVSRHDEAGVRSTVSSFQSRTRTPTDVARKLETVDLTPTSSGK